MPELSGHNAREWFPKNRQYEGGGIARKRKPIYGGSVFFQLKNVGFGAADDPEIVRGEEQSSRSSTQELFPFQISRCYIEGATLSRKKRPRSAPFDVSGGGNHRLSGKISPAKHGRTYFASPIILKNPYSKKFAHIFTIRSSRSVPVPDTWMK